MKYTGTFTSDEYSSFFGLFNHVYGDIVLDQVLNRINVTMHYKGRYRQGESICFMASKNSDNKYSANLSAYQRVIVTIDSDNGSKITGKYESTIPYDYGTMTLTKD